MLCKDHASSLIMLQVVTREDSCSQIRALVARCQLGVQSTCPQRPLWGSAIKTTRKILQGEGENGPHSHRAPLAEGVDSPSLTRPREQILQAKCLLGPAMSDQLHQLHQLHQLLTTRRHASCVRNT